MIIPLIKSLYSLSEPFNNDKTDNDYKLILEEIDTYSLGSQMYSLLKGSGRILDVPHFFREQLSRVYEACFFQNLLVKHETELLLKKLEEAGVQVIPLKGTVMAERFFGHFAARGTSDIDLFVRQEQLDEAIKGVQSAGFRTPADDSPIHYHTEWMKVAPGLPEPLVVELHWSFVPLGSSAMNTERVWDNSEPLPGYTLARGLSTEYTFYSLCLHGASHQMDSYKHMLDLVHLLCVHGEHINLQRVRELAVRDQTIGRVRAALSVTYASIPELQSLQRLPFKSKLRFWTPLNKEATKLKRMLFTISMTDSWRYKIRHLLRLLFPSRELAAYSMDEGYEAKSVTGLYFRLYRQRLRRMFGG